MAQKVGGVLIDIATNVAKVQKDFGNIYNAIKKFSYQAKRQLRSVGLNLAAAFSVYKIKQFVTEGVRAIDAMQDMAQSSGMASRAMQGWVQAASYAGIEATGVAKAVKRLNTNILDAHYGLGEAKRLFHDLGIEFDTTEGKMRDTGNVLDDISNKFAKMEDGSRKAGLANKILGRSGAAMIPVLNMSADGIKDVTKNLKKWGALVTDDTMKTMDRVNRNIKDMNAAIGGIKLQVLAGLAGELENISDVITSELKSGETFRVLGEELGVLLKIVAESTLGLRWFKNIAVSLAKDVGNRKFGIFFDKESNEKQLAELRRITNEAIRLLDRLYNPPDPSDSADGEGDGISGINKLLEDQRQLVSKALKEHRGKIGVLAHEHNQYLNIYKALSKVINATKDQLEIEKAIGKHIEKLRAEYIRLTTIDVWGNMKYGFADYADSVMDRNKQIQEAVVNGMKSMEDAIVDGLKKGKLEWDSFADAVISDIMRIVVRQQITEPFAKWIGGMTGGEDQPDKVPIGTRGNVIPPPLPTSPANVTAGRRGRVAASTINLSNDVKNIVKENTFLMNREVDEFVKKSEAQYRRMGRTLRRSLGADELGQGGVLGGPIGYSTPGGGPIVIPAGTVTGEGAPGGSISGTAENVGMDINLDDWAEKNIKPALDDASENISAFAEKWGLDAFMQDYATFVADTLFQPLSDIETFIKDPSWDTLEDIVKNQFDEDRIMSAATGWTSNIMEWTVDSLFGKGTADDLIDKITDGVKNLSWDDEVSQAVLWQWHVTEKIWENVKDGLTDIWEGIENGGEILFDFHRDAIDLIGDICENIWEQVTKSFENIGKGDFNGDGDSDWSDILDPIPNPGGIIGGDVGEAIDKINDVLNPTKWFRGRATGDEGGLTINVPVMIDNTAMASDLRTEIEKTVIEVLRRYA